jgi:hypothetical protein
MVTMVTMNTVRTAREKNGCALARLCYRNKTFGEETVCLGGYRYVEVKGFVAGGLWPSRLANLVVGTSHGWLFRTLANKRLCAPDQLATDHRLHGKMRYCDGRGTVLWDEDERG